MEDSFRVRADKIFGKLDPVVPSNNTTAPPSAANSLWCLTEEVERRKWNRRTEEADDDEDDDGVEEEKEESDLKKDPLESDLKDLSDVEEDEGEEGGGRMKRCRNTGDDDWDVQSSIGRDRTLDFEEEEDEFDKVAVGSDKQTGDRLYMKDVKVADYDIDDVDTYSELPNSFRAVEKDPRANHTAAKMRLKEDAEASGTLDTSISENGATSMDAEDSNREEQNVNLPKPILKKGERVTDSRPSKRVRFNCEPKIESVDQHTSGPSDLLSDPSKHNVAVEQHSSDLYSPGIPDYLRNPSKYTRYAFDSTEGTDEKSNKKAFMEFFESLRKRSNDPDDTPVDISKPVMFTPRTKPEDMSITKGGQETTVDSKNSCSVGIIEEDIQESEVSAMEEDKPPLAVESGSSIKKPGRQYRARTTSDDDSTEL